MKAVLRKAERRISGEKYEFDVYSESGKDIKILIDGIVGVDWMIPHEQLNWDFDVEIKITATQKNPETFNVILK